MSAPLLTEVPCAGFQVFYDPATEERTPFAEAVWWAWIIADEKADRYPWAVKDKPVGTIHRNNAGRAWVVVTVPVRWRS